MNNGNCIAFKFIVLAWCIVFCGRHASAQTVQGGYQYSDTPQWELGMDIMPLFADSANSQWPGFLLARYKLNEKTKLRARFGFTVSETQTQPEPFPDSEILWIKPLGFYSAVGFERYITVSRIAFYWGAEGFFSFFREWTRYDLDTREYEDPPVISAYRINYVDRRIGINFLGGINIRLLQHLTLGLESRLQTAYQIESQYATDYIGDPPMPFAQGGRTRKVFIAQLRPLASANVVYSF